MPPSSSLPEFLVLAGPTAVGKSEAALHLAQELNCEIVSIDSMQVYRGLDLGTAKPPPAYRRQVPHHLVDVVPVDQPFDAAQFVEEVNRILPGIRARGRRPLFCGGTGLYLKAWLDGLGNVPPSDATVRAALRDLSLPTLLHELAQADPVAYAGIDHRNRRRVVRALEVIRLTGKPFSQQRAAWSTPSERAAPSPGTGFWGIRRSSPDLYQRIDQRVDAMFEAGLVEETSRLLRQGLNRNPNALQAIGYRQVHEHLLGLRSLPDTIRLVKRRTREYARRQMTWFRHQTPVCWVDVEPATPAAAVAEQIARLLPSDLAS